MTTAPAPLGSIDALTRAETSLARFRLNLAFEPELERQYEAYSSDRRNRALRFWLLFGLLLRIIGLTSEFAIGGDMPAYGIAFRLGILLPVVLVSLAFLSPRYSTLTQGLAATAAPFLCVVGISWLGTIAPASQEARYFFLAGVNIVAINLVWPLRFHHAVAYTLASLAVYMAFAVFGGVDPRAVVDVIFIYTVAAAASLMVTYRNDIADRRAFLASEKISAQAAALTLANEELQRLLTTDALTGVYNRRYLDQSLMAHGQKAAADNSHLGVVMVDVDHFKDYNDMLGHRAGDECLREVARVIVANVRDGTDIVTRYGGEEFAVLVPGLPPEGTEALAERIRAAIEARALPHPRARDAKVTVSAGTSAIIPIGDGVLETLFETADRALYRSKNSGRNRVTRSDVPAVEGKSAA